MKVLIKRLVLKQGRMLKGVTKLEYKTTSFTMPVDQSIEFSRLCESLDVKPSVMLRYLVQEAIDTKVSIDNSSVLYIGDEIPF